MLVPARDMALYPPSSHPPKSAGKGQSQSYSGLFLQENKWGYGRRYMPDVTDLFLIVEHPESSSGAFSCYQFIFSENIFIFLIILLLTVYFLTTVELFLPWYPAWFLVFHTSGEGEV